MKKRLRLSVFVGLALVGYGISGGSMLLLARPSTLIDVLVVMAGPVIGCGVTIFNFVQHHRLLNRVEDMNAQLDTESERLLEQAAELSEDVALIRHIRSVE